MPTIPTGDYPNYTITGTTTESSSDNITATTGTTSGVEYWINPTLTSYPARNGYTPVTPSWSQPTVIQPMITPLLVIPPLGTLESPFPVYTQEETERIFEEWGQKLQEIRRPKETCPYSLEESLLW